MNKQFHSVTLDKEKCRGCTNCIKKCPTEAIRVRNGKAKIIENRCIDCGECIRNCPYHAKIAITDSINKINNFEFKIAIPAPTFYLQFKNISPDRLNKALENLGFDFVFPVPVAADVVTYLTKLFINNKNYKKPIISSACPTIVRLIQIRFPNLIENILPLISPMEFAALYAKEYLTKKLNISKEKIGVFFISPCAAKMTYINNPIGFVNSEVNGVIAIKDIYLPILNISKKIEDTSLIDHNESFNKGFIWAVSGGESLSLGIDEYLNVDGIQNVIKVLDEIENERLQDVVFFEGLACSGGCIGGPLVVENPYVAKNGLKNLKMTISSNLIIHKESLNLDDYIFKSKLEPNPALELDTDIEEAMKKYEKLNEIINLLPGLDCGACGSPNCKSLAEDIVRKQANDTDCIFVLRENIKQLANKMFELSNKLPPSLEKE